MNTRHDELKTNELAHKLEDFIKQVKPQAPVILGGVAVVLLAVAGWSWYSASNRAKSQLAWGGIITGLGNESALAQVAEDFPGTTAAGWAVHAQAISDLSAGCSLLFTNREDAEKRLKDAAAGFNKALKVAGGDRLLKVRANFGLAQAMESLFDLDAAKASYRQVLSDDPDGPLAELAKRQLDLLETPATKEFYAWFAKQTPEPPTPPLGQTPATGPLTPLSGDLKNLPDMPDLPLGNPPANTSGASPFQPADGSAKDGAAPPKVDDVYSKEAGDATPAENKPDKNESPGPDATAPAPATGSGGSPAPITPNKDGGSSQRP